MSSNAPSERILANLDVTARLFDQAPLHENAGVQAGWIREAMELIRSQESQLAAVGHKECETCGCYIAIYTQTGIDAARAEARELVKGLRIE